MRIIMVLSYPFKPTKQELIVGHLHRQVNNVKHPGRRAVRQGPTTAYTRGVNRKVSLPARVKKVNVVHIVLRELTRKGPILTANNKARETPDRIGTPVQVN